MCYLIIPGTIVEYAALKGRSFGKREDAKYFLFHGSPDITIKTRKSEGPDADEGAVVVDRDDDNIEDKASGSNDADIEPETDESAYNDFWIIENKKRLPDTVTTDGVVAPTEIAKVLANMHLLLVKKALHKGGGNLSDTLQNKGLFISRSLGACQLTMPIITIEDSIRTTASSIREQKIQLTSYIHGQMDRESHCCHLNSIKN